MGDDGNVDGRGLKHAVGEREERVTLFQHHLVSDHAERRFPLVTGGESEQSVKSCGDVASFRSRPKPRSASHQLGSAPRIGPLRECSVKLGAPESGANTDQASAREGPRLERDASD